MEITPRHGGILESPAKILGGERGDQKIRCHGRIHPESNTSCGVPLGCTCWQHGAEYTGVQSMLEPMHAAVGKPNGGAPSKVLTGKIHVVCHNKTQKLFARHCVAKQCLGSDGEWHTQ